MEKIVLISLAAGGNRQFSGNKLLHLFDGKPMYRCLVGGAGKLPGTLFEEKIVVAQYQEIMSAPDKEGYLVVENHEGELGISHSIELEIRTAGTWGDCGFCFAVRDQPYPKRKTVRTLADGFLQSDKGIGCLSHQRELGNPTVFSNRYREKLLILKGDMSGRRVIRRHPDDLFLCETEDRRELADVDVRKN